MSADTPAAGGTPTDGPAVAEPVVEAVPAVEPVADELAVKFTELGVSDEIAAKIRDELGVTTVDELSLLTEPDLVGVGMKPIQARGLVAKLTPTVAAAAPAAEAAVPATQPSMDILPSVPEDTSFLEMLKTGGVLKIQPVDVIAAMRAAIASRVGLYGLPDVLMEHMERFADEQEEPVGESFYALQKLITTRAYGDVLSAIGVTGNFVSERRKKEVLKRIDDRLWSSLRGFHSLLVGWTESWMQGMANPAAAMTMMAAMQMGGPGAVMPPGMMAPPETAGLRDEAEAVINRINGVFAGTGIPVARALAYDATRIKGILEEPALPAAVGATTKDQMLKMLGINVGADFVRLERNAVRYALSVMEFPKVNAGNEEYAYLSAMLMLGNAIPWEKLGGLGSGEAVTGIGGGRGDRRL